MSKSKQVRLYQEHTFDDLIIKKNYKNENKLSDGDVDIDE